MSLLSPLPAGVRAALAAHFASRYPERDDAAHLATYAPSAFLVVGDRVARRSELDASSVLAAWALVADDRAPQLDAPRCTAWHPHGDDAGMAVVELQDAREDVCLPVSVGLECHGGHWLVAWAMPLEGEPMPFERQALAALAEIAGLRAATLEGPLVSPFELAYARQRRLPRQRLLALPETHFSCAGTGACCRQELTIGIDEAERTFIEAVDWQAIAPHVGPGPLVEALGEAARGQVSFTHRLARAEDGRCRFLTADNRCGVHSLVGRAVFKPCHVFPYRFTWSPEGICVTVNAMCPTARFAQGAPLASQEANLRSRLAVADVLRTEHFYFRPGESVPWATFRTVESQLLELLNGDRPIKQKLWVALRWLAARLRDPDAGVEAAWYEAPIPRLGWLASAGSKRFGTLFDPCFKGLRDVEPGEGILPEQERELTRFFRSLLFSKVTSYPYGLVAGFNYVVLVHHVLERQVARHAKAGISEAFWREFYGVVTAGTFWRILAVCHQNPATLFARYAGAPAFGLNLLRA